MNTFINSPDLAITIARQAIRDRVQEAERRAQVRAVRAERRAARHAARPSLHKAPRRRTAWVLRLARPVH
jgi:hypothetical protein